MNLGKQTLEISKEIEVSNEVVIQEFKKRMLAWDNPVEYVNNMYGCHPNEAGIDYFKEIYKN